MEFKLFVSNIPFQCTEKEFAELMTKKEGISNVKLVCRGTGNSKGYGFVSANTEALRDSLINNKDIVINGRTLRFESYVNQHKFYKIHAANIPDNVNEQQVYDVFSKFGKVDSVKKDYSIHDKCYKGTAVVVYDNYEDFNTVLSMHEVKFDDTTNIAVSKRRTHRPQFMYGNASFNKRYVPTYKQPQHFDHHNKLTIIRKNVA